MDTPKYLVDAKRCLFTPSYQPLRSWSSIPTTKYAFLLLNKILILNFAIIHPKDMQIQIKNRQGTHVCIIFNPVLIGFSSLIFFNIIHLYVTFDLHVQWVSGICTSLTWSWWFQLPQKTLLIWKVFKSDSKQLPLSVETFDIFFRF